MLQALLVAVIRRRATHPRGSGRANPRRHRHKITTINNELRATDLLSSFVHYVYHTSWICLVVFSNIPQSKEQASVGRIICQWYSDFMKLILAT